LWSKTSSNRTNIILWIKLNKSKNSNLQINLKKPFLKRIWKNIVITKVINQSNCLKKYNLDYEYILHYKNKVKSGDTGNVEAVVAKKYFKILFGDKFIRSDENNEINYLLNYGYSVIRSCIARTVAAKGLIPSLGIFHCNKLNPYNLVDDLFEPYRALVDFHVKKHLLINKKIDINNFKNDFLNIFYQKIKIKNKNYFLNITIDNYIDSFVNCITLNSTKNLEIPEFDYDN